MRIALALLLILLQGPVIPLGPTKRSAARGNTFVYVTGSITGCYGGSAGNPFTKCVYAFHSNPGAGSLISCEAFWQDPSNNITGTMSGSANGSYTAITPKQSVNYGGTLFSAEMFQFLSSAAGTETITMNLNNPSVFAGFECDAYSHAGGTPVQDGNTYSSSVTLTTATVGPVTVVNSAGVLIAHCLGVTSSCSAGTGFTGHNDSAGTCNWNTATNTSCQFTNKDYNASTGSLIEEKFNAATGNQNASFTVGSGDTVTLGLVGY